MLLTGSYVDQNPGSAVVAPSVSSSLGMVLSGFPGDAWGPVVWGAGVEHTAAAKSVVAAPD
jgi:hypothetical protein